MNHRLRRARTVAVGVLVAVIAGYMMLDGIRQLTGIGYIAPGGRLGPWATLIEGLGFNPRSTGVAATLVGYAVLLAVAFIYYLTDTTAGAVALLIVAALGLWYLPFGALGSLIIIGLVVWDLATRSRGGKHASSRGRVPTRR